MVKKEKINKGEKVMGYIDLNSVGSTVTDEGIVFPIDCSEAPETASEAEEMMGALDWAQDIFRQGDEEVEADARAAGDR